MTNPPPNTRLRLRYIKDEVLQYTGHRDLLRLVMRLLRQAEIPFAYSSGFSPKPKVHFGPALPLGVLADNELVDIELQPGLAFTPADLLAIGKRITESAAPRRFFAGLDLLPGDSSSLAKQVCCGRYELVYDDACEQLTPLLETDTIEVEHKGKKVNLQPAIKAWRINEQTLHIDAKVGEPPALNIVRLADFIETRTGLVAATIIRRSLLDGQGTAL